MTFWLSMIAVVGVAMFVAYLYGRERLKREIDRALLDMKNDADETRDDVGNLSDDELDDELFNDRDK